MRNAVLVLICRTRRAWVWLDRERSVEWGWNVGALRHMQVQTLVLMKVLVSRVMECILTLEQLSTPF